MNDVKDSSENEVCKYVLELMPKVIFDEIVKVCHIGDKRQKQINEIRLRANAPSQIVTDGVTLRLAIRLSAEDIDKLYMKICHGTPFAFRECIINGYIPLDKGVRVGVGGEARYDGGAIVGVSNISVLVFRLPSARCSFAGDLYREWGQRGFLNMLVCSPPAIGKTTTLRGLVRELSLDKRDKNIVVVDQRCEFYRDDYSDGSVDILSGYNRHLGVDIAIRTMSAHYVVVDEIARKEECDAVMSAYGCGVGILASAHGESLEEIRKRTYIRELIDAYVFPLIALIRRDGSKYSYRVCEV